MKHLVVNFTVISKSIVLQYNMILRYSLVMLKMDHNNDVIYWYPNSTSPCAIYRI